MRAYLLVAVLSYSRWIFAKAFLAARQDDWLEGVADAFHHFGHVVRIALGDNELVYRKTCVFGGACSARADDRVGDVSSAPAEPRRTL